MVFILCPFGEFILREWRKLKKRKKRKNERDGREDGKRISEKVKQVESYHRLVLTQSSWREV